MNMARLHFTDGLQHVGCQIARGFVGVKFSLAKEFTLRVHDGFPSVSIR